LSKFVHVKCLVIPPLLDSIYMYFYLLHSVRNGIIGYGNHDCLICMIYGSTGLCCSNLNHQIRPLDVSTKGNVK
jgi:hypothetical protein